MGCRLSADLRKEPLRLGARALPRVILRGAPRSAVLRLLLLALALYPDLGATGLAMGCRMVPHQEGFSAMKSVESERFPSPDATLVRDAANGTVRFMKGADLSAHLRNDAAFRRAIEEGSAGEAAIAFIAAYRDLFRLHEPQEELAVEAVQTEESGDRHVRLKQRCKGIDVWPSGVNVHMDARGRIYLVEGRYVPTPVGLDVHPVLGETEALRAVAKNLGTTEDAFRKARAELIIYCGSDQAPVLAYRVYAEAGLGEAWDYVVDARSGDALAKTLAIRTQGSGKGSQGKIIIE